MDAPQQYPSGTQEKNNSFQSRIPERQGGVWNPASRDSDEGAGFGRPTVPPTISVEDRLNLKKLLSESECDDNTEHIRKVKHSEKIRDDIRALDTLKRKDPAMKTSDPDQFNDLARSTAPFLFSNYTDIFNKVLNDELDFGIMTKLLTVLKLIEDEKVDQHEGSVLVGKILKELYVDSAMKRGDRLDKEHESEKVQTVEPKNISWAQFRSGATL